MNLVDITPIAVAAVALCSGIVTVFVIPWIKANTSEKKRAELAEWVEFAVNAAEKLADSGQIPKLEKYEFVTKFLAKKGYTLDVDTVKVMVNNFVNKLPDQLTAIESSIGIIASENGTVTESTEEDGDSEDEPAEDE